MSDRWFTTGQAVDCSYCGREVPAGGTVWVCWNMDVSSGDEWLCDQCHAAEAALDDTEGDRPDPSPIYAGPPIRAKDPQTRSEAAEDDEFIWRWRRCGIRLGIAGAVVGAAIAISGMQWNGGCPSGTDYLDTSFQQVCVRPNGGIARVIKDDIVMTDPTTTTAAPPTSMKVPVVKPYTKKQLRAIQKAITTPDVATDILGALGE